MNPDFEKLVQKFSESLQKVPPDQVAVIDFLSKVQLVSDAECRQADVRICASERVTTENLESKCDVCGRPIFYDPGYTMGPLCRFVCLNCAIVLADDESSLSA